MELLHLDTIAAWVAVVVVLVHFAAARSSAFRGRLGHVLLHAVACLGICFSHGFFSFLAFVALSTWPLVHFVEAPELQKLLNVQAVGALVALAVTVLGVPLIHAEWLARSVLTFGFLFALALRVGLWPLGRRIEPLLFAHEEMKLAVSLTAAAAWIGFVRHTTSETLPLTGVPGAEIVAGLLAVSALMSALRAAQSPVPLYDFARAQVAAALAGGLLFMGSQLLFGYAFSALVGMAGLLIVLGSNRARAPLTYALDRRRQWLAALLVVLAVGCPLTALFVEEDLTMQGIAFPHPVVAALLALVQVVAAVAPIRFLFERLFTHERHGTSAHRTSTVVPALLAMALVLWGLAPHALDPAAAAVRHH